MTERVPLSMSDDERGYNDLAYLSMVIDDTTTMKTVDAKAFALLPQSKEFEGGYRARMALLDIYRGDTAAADAEIRTYVGAKLRPESAMLAGMISLALRRYHESQHYLEAAARLHARERSSTDPLDEVDPVMAGWFHSTSLAYLYLRRGDRVRAERLLRKRERADTLQLLPLEQNYGFNDVLYDVGVLAALRGKPVRAFQFLERAVEADYLLYRWMRFDPRLDALRGDSRYDALIKRAQFRADSIRALVIARRARDRS